MAVMNLPNIEFFLILGRAVFLVFSFAVAAVTFTAWRRSAREQAETVLAQNRAISEQLAALAARLNAADQHLAHLAERLEHTQPRAANAPAGQQGYQIAIRLARSGAAVDELIAGCGLTKAEAELVKRLHGPPLPELRQVS
ncbi:MAG: DUF2802 domain-containing protein [Pseudomonadota bacterium]|jgi:uncharacterized coiled-coil protein SlyX|nr:DUF2802 domain-containing protein [Pseudomonadota bacterium]